MLVGFLEELSSIQSGLLGDRDLEIKASHFCFLFSVCLFCLPFDYTP